MSRFAALLWPTRGDSTSIARAIRMGCFWCALAALISLGVAALGALDTRSVTFSSVATATIGGALLVAAARIRHGSSAAAATAVALWVLLGIVPTNIPVWMALIVLGGLIVGVRATQLRE